MLARPEFVSLFELVTRRLRAVHTIFGDNVKLVLRQLEEEHWSLLQLPYLLVVPTVGRTETGRAQMEGYDVLTVSRSITLIAQFDGRGSEAEHLAAADIELAEQQLIYALCNWRPGPCYAATQYGGMRLAGTRVPHVKTSYIFIFPEQVGIPDDVVGVDYEGGGVDQVFINVNAGCCPPEELPPGGRLPPVSVTPTRRL